MVWSGSEVTPTSLWDPDGPFGRGWSLSRAGSKVPKDEVSVGLALRKAPDKYPEHAGTQLADSSEGTC